MSDHSVPQHPNGAVDHHRPLYHLRPPRGYLNDPNGPIVVGDVAHLYFQSRPTVDRLVPVEWGHLTSTDFVTWRLHRPAMAPVPDGPDRDGCYSGNTVLDDGRVRAFYSGFRKEWPYQSVLTAVSDDGGYSFGPPVQVVPDPDPDEDVIMFRDPFVWQGRGRLADGRRGRLRRRPFRDPAVRLRGSARMGQSRRPRQPAPTGRSTDPRRAMRGNAPRFLTWPAARVAIVGTWSQVRGSEQRAVTRGRGADPTHRGRSRDELLRRLGVAREPIRAAHVRLDHRRPRAGPMGRGGLGRSTLAAPASLVRRRQHGSIGAGTERRRTAGRYRGTGQRRTHRCTMRDRRADCPGPCAPVFQRRRNTSTWSSKRRRTS